LTYFPLNDNIPGDIGDRVMQLNFLQKEGFHSFIEQCHNGFTLYKFYPPGWGFFNLPILNLVGSLQLTIFISTLLFFILGFLFIYFSKEKFFKLEKIAIFTLFFANPLMIDNIFNIGRVAETLAWVLFIPFFFLIYYYKNEELDYKFLWLIPIYSAMILSHPFVAFPASIFLLSLFLIKENKERVYILLSMLASLLITSFWWIPFLGILKSGSKDLILLSSLLELDSLVSFNTISLLAWLVLFYFYNKTNKKDLLFYSPLLVLNLLILSRIILFIPLFNKPSPGSYALLFLFSGIYLLFKIRFRGVYKKVINLALILFVIASMMLVFGFMQESSFKYNNYNEDFIEISKDLEGNFIVLGSEVVRKPQFLVNYAIINNEDLRSPMCRTAAANKDLDAEMVIKDLEVDIEEEDCENIMENIEKLEVDNIITFGDSCNVLDNCNLNLKRVEGNSCLFII